MKNPVTKLGCALLVVGILFISTTAFPITPFSFAKELGSHLATLKSNRQQHRVQNYRVLVLSSTSNASNEQTSTAYYYPIFNFSDETQNAASKFERIDDAIMGGISLSSLRQVPGEDFARWSGICRLDGGGFCGTRTIPFEQPLKVDGAVGLYLLCRLTSDDEPERRLWKVSTRTEKSRFSEDLYQAEFKINRLKEEDGWLRVIIPFSSFVQVRGPRRVEGGIPLNTTKGLFQLGLSMSKFLISKNVTEMDNFRAGYFELQLAEIGVYSEQENGNLSVDAPTTLSAKEIELQRPLRLRILLPVAKAFFSEKRRRRNSAMKILRSRGLSWFQAVKFGFNNRVCRKGFLLASTQSLGILVQDLTRTVVFLSLRLSLVYPVVAVSRIIKFLSGSFKRMICHKTAVGNSQSST